MRIDKIYNFNYVMNFDNILIAEFTELDLVGKNIPKENIIINYKIQLFFACC